MRPSKRTRPDEDWLNHAHQELMRIDAVQDLIFSVEKIHTFNFFLHIKANDEVFSRWVDHDGRLNKKKLLSFNTDKQGGSYDCIGHD